MLALLLYGVNGTGVVLQFQDGTRGTIRRLSVRVGGLFRCSSGAMVVRGGGVNVSPADGSVVFGCFSRAEGLRCFLFGLSLSAMSRYYNSTRAVLL